MENLWNQLITTWASGGWVMPALAFLALVLYTSAAHLLVTLYHRGLTRATDSTLKGWVARPSQAPRQLQELIRYTQDEAGSLADLEGRFRESPRHSSQAATQAPRSSRTR